MPFSKTAAIHVGYFWQHDVVACPRSITPKHTPHYFWKGATYSKTYPCTAQKNKLEDGPTDDTCPTFVVSGTNALVAAARTKVTYSWRNQSAIRQASTAGVTITPSFPKRPEFQRCYWSSFVRAMFWTFIPMQVPELKELMTKVCGYSRGAKHELINKIWMLAGAVPDVFMEY